MRTVLFLCLVSIALPVVADVFRWVDKDGVVHYSDKAPTPDAKPAELPKLQAIAPKDVIGGESLPSAPAGAADGAASADAAPGAPVILSPGADETIRDAQRQVNVSLSEGPPPDYAFIYYLDGTAKNASPTSAAAWTLTGVERGAHQVSVALVDAQGAEVARSAPVTFYMKPPTADMAKSDTVKSRPTSTPTPKP